MMLCAKPFTLYWGIGPCEPVQCHRRGPAGTTELCNAPDTRRLKPYGALDVSVIHSSQPVAMSTPSPDEWGHRGLEATVERLSSALSLPPAMVRDVVVDNSALLLSSSVNDLISTVHALSAALALQPERTLLMLSKRPVLLETPVEELLAQCKQIAAAMSFSLEQTAKLVCAQPGLLDLPIETLSMHVRRMAPLLKVQNFELAAMLARVDGEMLGAVLLMPSNAMQQQLIDIQAVLDSRLSTGRSPAASVLVLRNPALLTAHTRDLVLSLDQAMQLVQVPRRHMAKLLVKCPRMLTMSPSQLTSQFRGLVSALRVAPSIVVSMLRQDPRLVLMPPKTAQSRMGALQHMLFMPRQQAISVAVRQPQLLQYSSLTLQHHLVELKSMLRVSIDVALLLVGRHPNLLCFTPLNLHAKLRHLASLTSLPLARAIELVLREPVLLTLQQERLADSYQGLQTVLQLSDRRRLAKVVQQTPTLLLQAPARLAELVADAAMLLSVPESQVADMAVRKPAFLLEADLRLWQTNLDSLTSHLGLSVPTARSLVRLFPALLSSPAMQLYQRCVQLHAVLGGHRGWSEALEAAPPTLIRKCLYYGPREMEHLRYLAVSGLQGECGPCSPVLHDRDAFAARFAGFPEWLRRSRAANGQRAIPAAWNGAAANGWVSDNSGESNGSSNDRGPAGGFSMRSTSSSSSRNDNGNGRADEQDLNESLEVDMTDDARVVDQGEQQGQEQQQGQRNGKWQRRRLEQQQQQATRQQGAGQQGEADYHEESLREGIVTGGDVRQRRQRNKEQDVSRRKNSMASAFGERQQDGTLGNGASDSGDASAGVG